MKNDFFDSSWMWVLYIIILAAHSLGWAAFEETVVVFLFVLTFIGYSIQQEVLTDE